MEYIEFPDLESEHEIGTFFSCKYWSSGSWTFTDVCLCCDGGSVDGVDDHAGKADESCDDDSYGEYSASDCSIFNIFFISKHIGGIKKICCFYNAFYFF